MKKINRIAIANPNWTQRLNGHLNLWSGGKWESYSLAFFSWDEKESTKSQPAITASSGAQHATPITRAQGRQDRSRCCPGLLHRSLCPHTCRGAPRSFFAHAYAGVLVAELLLARAPSMLTLRTLEDCCVAHIPHSLAAALAAACGPRPTFCGLQRWGSHCSPFVDT